MAKSLLIPAMFTGAAAFVAPSQGNLRASAPSTEAKLGAAPSGAAPLAAAGVLGCAAVAAATMRRPVRKAAAKATTVAMRAENPRVEKLRTMEKTVQVEGELDFLTLFCQGTY